MVSSLLASGYIGLFVFIVLTGFGLPLPEELAVVTAGALSARGVLDPTLAVGVCMVGALVGDCAVYGLGRWAGHHVGAAPRWWLPTISPERLASTQALLHRHGFLILFVARFLIGFRFAVYLAIAASRLSFARFVALDSICVVAVVGTFFALSHELSLRMGSALFDAIHTGHLIATAVVLVVAAVVALVVRARRGRAPKKENGAAVAPPSSFS
jgi:membrane protein DedA with SNARE-associated domain